MKKFADTIDGLTPLQKFDVKEWPIDKLAEFHAQLEAMEA
jgi:hypothetical protein